jgi:hypothetical protein
LINGRSIKETITEYSIQHKHVDPETITDWSTNFPASVKPGMYLFMRMCDKYDDGTSSGFRYSSSYYGTDGSSYSIDFSNDSATISASNEGVINENTLKSVTNMTVNVWNGSANITESCTFRWNAIGGTLQNTEGNINYFTTMQEDTATA